MENIAEALGGLTGGCSHSNKVEAKLLTGLDDITTAKQKLITECVNEREPCLHQETFLDTITFTSSCTGETVLVDIDNELTKLPTTCHHSKKIEAMLLTDNRDNLDAAKQTLIEECQKRRGPCLDDLKAFSALDFVSCDHTTVLSTLETAILAKDCPHSKIVEAQLLTTMETLADAKKELQDLCKQTLQPCLESVDSLMFQSPTCVQSDIMLEMKAMLDDKNCGHDLNQELLLLTRLETVGDAKHEIKQECLRDLTACTDLSGVEINLCDRSAVMKAIKTGMDDNCPHSPSKELMLLTGTTTVNDANAYIKDMCNDVWSDVDESALKNIDPDFAATDFVSTYFEGGTFLNSKSTHFFPNLYH